MDQANLSFLSAKLFTMVGQVRVRKRKWLQGRGVVNFQNCVNQFKREDDTVDIKIHRVFSGLFTNCFLKITSFITYIHSF